jgi:hypothetical protein
MALLLKKLSGAYITPKKSGNLILSSFLMLA